MMNGNNAADDGLVLDRMTEAANILAMIPAMAGLASHTDQVADSLCNLIGKLQDLGEIDGGEQEEGGC